jgi:adenylate kinase family enzyme
MRENQGTSLAVTIQEKLDRQGFLTPEDLNPFIGRAIKEAIAEDQAGIIVDGFPRNADQLASFEHWPFQEELPIKVEEEKWLPDVVLLFNVDKEKARERCLARGRDKNDSAEKFENRHAEYLREGPPVEQAYRSAGVLLEVGGPLSFLKIN